MTEIVKNFSNGLTISFKTNDLTFFESFHIVASLSVLFSYQGKSAYRLYLLSTGNSVISYRDYCGIFCRIDTNGFKDYLNSENKTIREKDFWKEYRNANN